MGSRASSKLLVIQVAGLGYDFLSRHHGEQWQGLTFQSASTVFPALTCPVQGSFRTAVVPEQHGMVANGLWDETYARARFWEQSSRLVQGPRIWSDFRAAGHTVGMLFWQQSLGEDVDVVLSPAPIHKHHGGMIQDCYAQPPDLYHSLRRDVGRDFNLMHYWGPMASRRSSAWIADSTAALLARPDAPELCFTYLPVLDYDLQRFGTSHPRATQALKDLFDQLSVLMAAAREHGYELLIFGDYALADVTGKPVLPNMLLREQDLMRVRMIKGMAYPDLYASRAFVLADHEVGHVQVRDPADRDRVIALFRAQPGLKVLDDREPLTLLAPEGSWIAYPWWTDAREAPDFASHVDIHNKPGYDPAELFWGWPPGSVSRQPERIRGTHGRNGPGREVAWASTCFNEEADDLLALAGRVRQWTHAMAKVSAE
jgi:predicted AlkP superfamily pyrophosphatase or phosphodiesterase